MQIDLTWFEAMIMAAVALTTTAGLFAFNRWSAQASEPKVIADDDVIRETSLNFDFNMSGELVCSNESGASLLADLNIPNATWVQFRDQFSDRFSELPFNVLDHKKLNPTVLSSRSIADPMEMEITPFPDGISIIIRCEATRPSICTSEVHQAFSGLKDLDLIRAVSEHAPYPVWQTFPDGRVGWTNAKYQSLDNQIERSAESGAKRKSSTLFPLSPHIPTSAKPTRVSLKDKGHNRTYWFDVSHHTFGESQLNFAMDIHAVVNAESAQRNFVQTLAKTFAHLTTGLAIFNRNRQLMLFNPSLIDLTELNPEFLTARPNLFSFFDQLRDNQVMPEPKSYSSWRERVADMISAASDDNFNETWHLPNGLTYRVTGRPHPDGAIAFLFEDISAEISLTRRFRSEASVTRSALDALNSGIIIFNAAGLVQQCNRAMLEFVELDPAHPIDQMSAHDITRNWQGKCLPNPAWGDIRDFIFGQSHRETWTTDLQHKDGRSFTLQVSPLASGATLVTLTANAMRRDPARKSSKRSKSVAA